MTTEPSTDAAGARRLAWAGPPPGAMLCDARLGAADPHWLDPRWYGAQARPVLLEPLLDLEVWTPDETLGEVMGDLSSRRGQILGSEPDGRLTKVRATVPEAELYRYSTTLHSITHGRGTFRQRFHGYEQAPPEVATKVASEGRNGDEEE